MNARAGEWRPRLLLAAFSTLLGLALAEMVARLILRPGPAKAVEGTPISQTSPTLGWRARASGSQRIRREDFEVTISINRNGLRGPELPFDPLPGVRRLAIMGDSFAHGYYAPEPLTLRGRLDAALGSCRVEVVNAGGPGYSTDQAWIYFNEEISKYRPKEVVLLFYYNDLHFNVERMGTANRAKPVFEERDGLLELVAPASMPLPDEIPAESATLSRPAPTFHNSALWAFAAARLQRSRPDWARALSKRDLMPALSENPPAEYLPFGPKDGLEESRVREMWRRTGQILGRFREDVRQAGAGLSVFYVPARFEENDDAWAFLERRYEANRPWRRDSVRTRLKQVLADLDIPLIEVTDEFRRAERTKDPAYLAIDGHWNARGNEIAFESLLPFMRRAFSCAS